MIPGFSPAGYYPGAKQMNIQTAVKRSISQSQMP
jgi:hypothetical protein